MLVSTSLQHFARLAASAMLAVVLVLSGAMPVLSAAKAPPPASAGTAFKSDVASTDDETAAECLLCGSTICSGLDALLDGAAVDVAVMPSSAHPVLQDKAGRLPPARAPPSYGVLYLPPFDPRGPPPAG